MMDGQIMNMAQKMDFTLKALYAELRVGEKAEDFAAGRVLGEKLGFEPTIYLRDFMDLGIFEREGPIYGTFETGLSLGRHYNYTLLVDYEEARRRLDDFLKHRNQEITKARVRAGKRSGETKRAKKADKKAAHTTTGITREEIGAETVAIVGDDAPEGLAAHVPAEVIAKVRAIRSTDEAGALIEAARQYLRRTDTIGSQIDSLEKTAKDLGVRFDREAIMASFTLHPDERLEIVADLLPYIDKLEGKVETIKQQMEGLREKGRQYDELKRNYDRLKTLHDQTIAGRVAQGQSVASTH